MPPLVETAINTVHHLLFRRRNDAMVHLFTYFLSLRFLFSGIVCVSAHGRFFSLPHSKDALFSRSIFFSFFLLNILARLQSHYRRLNNKIQIKFLAEAQRFPREILFNIKCNFATIYFPLHRVACERRPDQTHAIFFPYIFSRRMREKRKMGP